MADPLFQFTGIASQVDWGAMIDKIIQRASAPVVQMEAKIDSLELKKSLYNELGTALKALQQTLTTLKLPSTFTTKKAETASLTAGLDAKGILTATADTSAAISQWRIKVNNIAVAERRTSVRQSSVSDALGMAGTFRVQIGNQWADLTVRSTDSLREINYNLSKLTDSYGNRLLVEARIVDNRIVLQSIETGRGAQTTLGDIAFTMGTSDKMVLPNPDAGRALPDAVSIRVNRGDNTYTNYTNGVDFTYNASTGEIKWLTRTPTNKRPNEGDNVEITFLKMKASPITKSDGTDVVLTKAGTMVDTTSPRLTAPMILKSADGSYTYVKQEDYTFNSVNGNITWQPGKGPVGGAEYISYSVGNDITSTTGDRTDGFQLSTPYMAAVFITNNATNTKYNEGVDFTYNRSAGKITWIDVSAKPDISDITITGYADNNKQTHIRSGFQNETYADLIGKNVAVIKTEPDSGVKYYAGVDYTFNSTTGIVSWVAGRGPVNTTEMRAYDTEAYSYSTTENIFSLRDMTGNVARDLFRIGQLDEAAHHTDAVDANLVVDGVAVTRSSNEIDDLIAGVKLKLVGAGDIVLDITMDAEKAVTATQNFVTAYNDVMDWINIKLEEESQEKPANSTLNADFYKKFGLLHGDSFLWMLKDQLRSLISYPVPNMSNTYSTKGFANSNTPLNMSGPLSVDINGKRVRIDIALTDSLQDIRAKLHGLTDMTATTPNGTASGGALPFDVTVENGKLLIRSTATVSGPSTRSETLYRSSGSGNLDPLPFTPSTAAPINGKFSITQGTKKFAEGIDFDIVTNYNQTRNTYESSIKWKGANTPSSSLSYSVIYNYNEGMVGVSGADRVVNGLGFFQERSAANLAYIGISTVPENFGKSGKIDFSEEKFMNAMIADPNKVGQLMNSFAKELDTTLTGIVSTSQVQVGTTVVTRGRLTARIQGIDTEIQSIEKQISAFEARLLMQQQTLYARFTAMEQSMSKLNSQMSWLSSVINSNSSS